MNAADTAESTAVLAMPGPVRPGRTVAQSAATPLPRRSPGAFACAGITSDYEDDSTMGTGGRSISLLDGTRRAEPRPRTVVGGVWAALFAGVTAARERRTS